MTERRFMEHAISLALKGTGHTNPNPLVGAVIVRDGKILAEGWHHEYGSLHAERDALESARKNGIDVRGAEIYVTLEPCCHYGKQPPCTQALIESGIIKVIIGSRDPNPLVNGRGKEILEQAGIEVVEDFMKEECDAINPVFFHYIKAKNPYVILKYAVTADGMTATSAGNSRWITGETARTNVHLMRSRVMAVMTGIKTVKADDPLLNVRLEDKTLRQPVRVVLDKNLEISCESKLVQTACENVLYVFTSGQALREKSVHAEELKKYGVRIFEAGLTDENHLELEDVLSKLGSEGIDSLLVESGGELNAAFLFNGKEKKCLADEIHVYVAPKIAGNDGKNIFSPVRGRGISDLDESVMLSRPEVEVFGDDVLLKYKVSGGRQCLQE